MAAWLSRVQSQAKDLWSNMGTPVKVLLGLALVGVVGGSIAYYSLSNRTVYARLGTLTPQDAAKVLPKLNDAKIPYKASSDGASIMVPQDSLMQAELILGTNGLSDVPGLEIFDKPNLLTTQFERDVNLKRGLEGQLTRAINTMDKVDSSSVILAMPKDSVFVENREPAKATIVIGPKPGKELTKDEVKSIIMTVSNAIPGLKPENVFVTDIYNHLLSRGVIAGNDDTGLASDQLALQQSIEDRLSQQLQTRLEAAFGLGNVTVAVTAVPDWTKTSQVTQTYTQGPKVSEQINRESATTGDSSSGSSTSGGSGLPTFNGTGSSGGGSVDKSTATNNYDNNSNHTETTTPAGSALKSLAVTVLVNSDKVPADDVTKVQDMATAYAKGAAAGIVPAVVVTPVKFNTDLATAMSKQASGTAPAETTAKTNNWLKYLPYSLIAVGLLLVFFLFRRRPTPVAEAALAGPPLGTAGALEMLAAASDTPVADDGPKTPAQRLLDLQEKAELLGEDFLNELGIDPAKQKLREEVESLARENPETVANLLKTWISEE